HTPDNTFLGFVVQHQLSMEENEKLKSTQRSNQALIYGKSATFWQGKESYLDVIYKYLDIHGTVDNSILIPRYVTNHDIIKGTDVQTLLRQSKHPVRLILHPITFRRLAFKGPSSVFLLGCQLTSSTTPTPPRTLWASGKRIKNSYTSPAKRRRGSPASSPAPAAASPGLISPAVLLPSSSLKPIIFPASFISFMDSPPALHVIPDSPAVTSPPSLPHQYFLFPLHRSCLLFGSFHRRSPLLAPSLACL
ncbi:hypothetical protein ATANTOWER_020562, partial [Ataeniobius toweri]|nr:hypothetical protein [Ataeniobius toweri]